MLRRMPCSIPRGEMSVLECGVMHKGFAHQQLLTKQAVCALDTSIKPSRSWSSCELRDPRRSRILHLQYQQ
eukprot:6364079-Amphidinium_carterae.1